MHTLDKVLFTVYKEIKMQALNVITLSSYISHITIIVLQQYIIIFNSQHRFILKLPNVKFTKALLCLLFLFAWPAKILQLFCSFFDAVWQTSHNTNEDVADASVRYAICKLTHFTIRLLFLDVLHGALTALS